jgi:hypothetical protein
MKQPKRLLYYLVFGAGLALLLAALLLTVFLRIPDRDKYALTAPIALAGALVVRFGKRKLDSGG